MHYIKCLNCCPCSYSLRAKYEVREGIKTLQKPSVMELVEMKVLKMTRNLYRMTDENTITLGSLVGAVGAEAIEFNSRSPATTMPFDRSSERGIEMNPMVQGMSLRASSNAAAASLPSPFPPPQSSTGHAIQSHDSDDEYG